MLDDRGFLDGLFAGLTDSIDLTWPSEWAEANRYLSKTESSHPGHFSFELTPYLREIVDSMDPREPCREVTFMKGTQIGATAGVLENTIGWCIGHVKSVSMLFATATDDLVKIRMDENVTKMIQQSGLMDCLASSDKLTGGRKAAKTDKKMSWLGGGYCIPVSAQSASKLRSFPIRIVLEDEVDGWPLSVGSEGDPCVLVEKRTDTFEDTKKILRVSTPLDAATSRIAAAFKSGDRRKFYVPCLKCGEMQVLKFDGKTEDGEVFGLQWEMDKSNERLVPGSVRYFCRYCQHPHVNENKSLMLKRGEWRATAKPEHPTYRSFHLSALYSPPGMFSWESAVMAYLKGFDYAANRVKDMEKYRAFYNTVLGEPFENRGMKLTHKTVSKHRRKVYKYGEVPNSFMKDHATGPASFVLCTVDVHKANLRVAVFAFAPGGRMFVIDYWTFEGDTEQPDDPGTWGELAKLVTDKVYTADDGRRYALAMTLVDASYQAEAVYTFCSRWPSGVLPIQGRSEESGHKLTQPWRPFVTKTGTRGAQIGVDLFKDRLSARLKYAWDGHGFQPEGHYNVPHEMSGADLRELTVEFKTIEVDKKTLKRRYMWKRPHSNARQELWDLSVYAMAAVDILAHDVMVTGYSQPAVDWAAFWRMCEEQRIFWRPPARVKKKP